MASPQRFSVKTIYRYMDMFTKIEHLQKFDRLLYLSTAIFNHADVLLLRPIFLYIEKIRLIMLIPVSQLNGYFIHRSCRMLRNNSFLTRIYKDKLWLKIVLIFQKLKIILILPENQEERVGCALSLILRSYLAFQFLGFQTF